MSKIASHRLLFQALLVAMSNPKAIVFLTALLPQFINVEGALLPQFAIIIATVMFFSFFFLMLYPYWCNDLKGGSINPEEFKILNDQAGPCLLALAFYWQHPLMHNRCWSLR